MGVFIDLTGRRFGRLVVLDRAPNHKKQVVWRCMCDCGTVREVQGGHLRAGKIVSCGCYQSDNSRRRATRHGKHGSKLYMVWLSMRQRCNNPNSRDYPHYGARGITVCAEWDDYATFERWALSNGYTPGLTIERNNVDGNYCPENCSWIPKGEQAKNTTRNLNYKKNH